jgi:hypothetical protein
VAVRTAEKRGGPMIAEAWKRFEAMVLPASASAVQRSEMRKAFYAGASVMFQTVTQGMSEGAEIQEQDLQLLDGIAKEVEAYGAELDRAVLRQLAGGQSS